MFNTRRKTKKEERRGEAGRGEGKRREMGRKQGEGSHGVREPQKMP